MIDKEAQSGVGNEHCNDGDRNYAIIPGIRGSKRNFHEPWPIWQTERTSVVRKESDIAEATVAMVICGKVVTYCKRALSELIQPMDSVGYLLVSDFSYYTNHGSLR
jgi:hypothetical protein